MECLLAQASGVVIPTLEYLLANAGWSFQRWIAFWLKRGGHSNVGMPSGTSKRGGHSNVGIPSGQRGVVIPTLEYFLAKAGNRISPLSQAHIQRRPAVDKNTATPTAGLSTSTNVAVATSPAIAAAASARWPRPRRLPRPRRGRVSAAVRLRRGLGAPPSCLPYRDPPLFGLFRRFVFVVFVLWAGF